uniref:Uncharacterized protein n=1 Tax=Rhizophora mucronata TaxID=61149 RepID=A0A2P2PIP7_RHIMU
MSDVCCFSSLTRWTTLERREALSVLELQGRRVLSLSR